jgi:tight adherence protein C
VVVDALDHREGVVMASLATTCGALTLLAILLAGVAGRRPPGRRPVARGLAVPPARRSPTLPFAAARRRREVQAAVPDAVELLVLCVHAGRSPVQAVLEVGGRGPPSLRPAFAAVELALHRGRSLAEAVSELPRHIGPAGRELASALAMADRDGLPLAPLLDRLADDARATRRRLGEAAARRLPVHLSFPLVVCTLPSFVLLAIAPAVLGALSTLRAPAP